MYKNQSDEQKKQLINSIDAFRAFLSAQSNFKRMAGSMYWSKYGSETYLVKEDPSKRKHRLGLLSETTEALKLNFDVEKVKAADILARRKETLTKNMKLNRVHAVGAAPSLLTGLWNNLRSLGLEKNFLLIGTNALHVYESLAGVHFFSPITATEDIDLLWDNRKDVQLLEVSAPGVPRVKPTTFIGVLQKVDPSFTLDSNADCRAINKSGVMVDLVRPRAKSFHDEKGPMTVFPAQEDIDDIWPAAIFDMNWLLSLPCVEHPIVALDGSMAMGRTIDPRAFALHKAWLSRKDNRDPLKTDRDLGQAKAVGRLIQDRLPQFEIADIPSFPSSLLNLAKRLGVWEMNAGENTDGDNFSFPLM